MCWITYFVVICKHNLSIILCVYPKRCWYAVQVVQWCFRPSSWRGRTKWTNEPNDKHCGFVSVCGKEPCRSVQVSLEVVYSVACDISVLRCKVSGSRDYDRYCLHICNIDNSISAYVVSKVLESTHVVQQQQWLSIPLLDSRSPDELLLYIAAVVHQRTDVLYFLLQQLCQGVTASNFHAAVQGGRHPWF